MNEDQQTRAIRLLHGLVDDTRERLAGVDNEYGICDYCNAPITADMTVPHEPTCPIAEARALLAEVEG